MIMRCIEIINELEFVKNSIVYHEQITDRIICVHYDTEIIILDENGIVEELKIPSNTSSKMAKRVFEFFTNGSETWDQVLEKFPHSKDKMEFQK